MDDLPGIIFTDSLVKAFLENALHGVMQANIADNQPMPCAFCFCLFTGMIGAGFFSDLAFIQPDLETSQFGRARSHQ